MDRQSTNHLADGNTMTEVEELRNRVAVLEAALLTKQSDDYDIVIVRKPEPLPPLRLTGYWNVYGKKGSRCQVHVHFSKQAADNAAWTRDRKACLLVEWEEGQTEGVWADIKDKE